MRKKMVKITEEEYAELLKCKSAYETISRARQNYRDKIRDKYNEYHREYYRKRREEKQKQIDNEKNDDIIKGETQCWD